MSARSCSAACAVFFSHDAAALEEAADDAGQRLIVDCGVEPVGDFHQGEIRLLVDPVKDQLPVGVDPVRAVIAAPLVGFQRFLGPGPLYPADRRRHAYTKTDEPASTASTTRQRRSTQRDFAIRADLLHRPIFESDMLRKGIPNRFKCPSKRSKYIPPLFGPRKKQKLSRTRMFHFYK